MTQHELTPAQVAHYHEQGYVIIPGVFSPAECQAYVTHHLELQAGRLALPGMPARKPDEWGRTHNQHFWDPVAMDLLLHPRLRRPLEQVNDGPVDAVQSMYFWRGSEQRRHQDQYYLPDCFAAWIAFVDVSDRNGTIWVQPGSHKRRLVVKQDFLHLLKSPEDNPIMVGEAYSEEVDRVFAANSTDLIEVPVVAPAGAVVIFHGALIHRGGQILEPGSFRHVMANHYIPYHSTSWPYHDWPRYSFAGERRTFVGQPQPAAAAK